MTGTAEVFDRSTQAWTAWQQAPWGRLRYELVASLLDRHLRDVEPAGDRLVVVDVGGGDGADSIRLAAAGARVVVADQSAAMLRAADDRAAAAGVSVTTVTTVVRETADVAGLAGHPELRAVVPGGADVVLCHNVVQYCEDLDAVLASALAVARPGALVSVMAANPVSQVLARAVRHLDPDGALQLLDAPTIRATTFDHDVRRIPWSDAVAALEGAGCTVVQRYGVLCVNHLVTDDERKQDPDFLAALGRLELSLADRDPYRDVAAMWLVVARR